MPINKLSPSEKDVFLDCRLRWHYQYVEKPDIPRRINSSLLRGTAGHAALEAFYSAEPSGRSLDMLIANFEQSLVEQAPEDIQEWQEEEFRSAAHSGREALQHFWKSFGTDSTLYPVETEVRLARNIGDVEYHGVADGIWRPGNRVVLLEHKFPADIYGQALEYLYWNSQHRAYAWMLDEKLPVYVQYTFCTPKKALRVEELLISRAAMEEEERVAYNIAKSTDLIYPTYGWHCQRCDFNKLCMVRLSGGDA